MRRAIRLGVLLVLLKSASAAVASDAPRLESDPAVQRVLECLAMDGGVAPPITYPPDSLRREGGGVVRVRLEFTAPDRPPDVSVLFSSGSTYLEAIQPRIGAYRLPCLRPASAPVVAVQEFAFHPNDSRPVFPSKLASADAFARCTLDQSRAGPVVYPTEALNRGEQGNVLVRATYAAPGLPTEVKALNSVGSGRLVSAALRLLERTAMVCQEPAGPWPKQAVQTVAFRIEGQSDVKLADMSLRGFVQNIKDLDLHRVRFDFSTMACPFTVQLSHDRPYVANGVAEVGDRDPNRIPFLAWLSTVELRIPPETAKFLVGSTMRISVPCGVLDLAS